VDTDAAPRSEDDLQAAQPALIVRVGGGIVLGAGVLAILVTVQTLSGFWVSSGFTAVLVVLAVVGAATGAMGLMIMRARAWAAVAGLVCSALLFFMTMGWLVMSLGSGLVSLFAMGAPLVALVATAFAAGSIGPCRRASAARARLAAQGLALGI
jgi:hypothetical protein